MKPSQRPHDGILWILSDHDGNMKISELRRRPGLRLHEIAPILEDLERDDRIRIDARKMVTLSSF